MVSIISVLDKFTLAHTGPSSEDASAVVTSVFEEVDTVTQKLFKSSSVFGIILDLFLSHQLLGHHPDDTTTLEVLLRGQEVT